MAPRPARPSLPVVQSAGWSGLPFHLGMTSADLGTAMDDLSSLLGARWTPVIEDPMPGLVTPAGPVEWGARRVHSLDGPIRIELFEGFAGSTWATGERLFLHHVAFWSDDVPADVAHLAGLGWRVEVSYVDSAGQPAEFVYLVHPEEPRIELVDSRRRGFYASLLAGDAGGLADGQPAAQRSIGQNSPTSRGGTS